MRRAGKTFDCRYKRQMDQKTTNLQNEAKKRKKNKEEEKHQGAKDDVNKNGKEKTDENVGESRKKTRQRKG